MLAERLPGRDGDGPARAPPGQCLQLAKVAQDLAQVRAAHFLETRIVVLEDPSARVSVEQADVGRGDARSCPG